MSEEQKELPNNRKAVIQAYEEDYEELMNQARFLECLRAAGVDNWSGYTLAQDMVND